ncbi:TPA: hypothetical protein DCZ15_02665 [Candidatus Falkowbacteria bacterium]|nr:MAG: Glycosyltransferase [Candidatus Falkowbacteria bacterium GW2011_GWF2_43_32]HBA36758.1 hypothetical protein [Candidatus Falkowbacteria bacterium]
MKIGLIHNLYGQFSRGGAETVVEMMLNELRQSGHEVFLISTRPLDRPRDKNQNSTTQAFKIYDRPSRFYRLAEMPKWRRLLWHGGQLFFPTKRQIRKILLTEKPDLIITHNLSGLGFRLPIMLRKLKIRHEHFLHDIQLLHPSGLLLWGQEKKLETRSAKIYQALTRAYFASPAKIISPSRWLLETHRQRGFFKNSATEIRPFRWPQSAEQRQITDKTAKHFLFVGQIEEQKGVFLLIKAFRKLTDPDVSLTFAIRNGGQKITAAQKAAAGDTRIKFLGPLSYEETKKIMLTGDCLVVPSLCYENSPTVIYGAQSVNLPVLAAAIGGIPEIIGPRDRLFRPGDESDLLKKLAA